MTHQKLSQGSMGADSKHGKEKHFCLAVTLPATTTHQHYDLYKQCSKKQIYQTHWAILNKYGKKCR